ncbi:MAG TPA: serine/threonine-protein kinase, partial [Planctomycetota bacterium]|nr:serine/threonine-protein kinase [Planctomycetota bacterium]
MTDREVCGRCSRELPSGSLEKDFGGICPHCLGALLAREEIQGPSWASGTLTPFDIDHAPLLAGDIFRSMEILQIVARGGMGYVYRARQTPLNRIVALKILAPELAASESFRVRFDREAKILAALNHPNIVQVFDFGREGDLLFLSMEHVEGTDLQTIFDKDERLNRLKLLNIVRDVARGLRCIHEAGLVHRDIKPANLLITPSGQAKIADFGIAIEAQETERLTETGTFIGSPHYVSPEHVQAKRVDGRSDLYSLGCILFQGLSGRTPFSAPSPSALLLKHVQEAPPAIWKSASDLPAALGDLLRRLLAKNPAARPDSARNLERDLDRIIQGISTWQSIEEPPKLAEALQPQA